ncbi:MAG: HEXXH motif-containing putative peptide modification protein [Leptolyngbyaceae bacterium]|nr:HEXXH motif-containing putative peptide modification protein [Leptolyngbyaceae bacterium]
MCSELGLSYLSQHRFHENSIRLCNYHANTTNQSISSFHTAILQLQSPELNLPDSNRDQPIFLWNIDNPAFQSALLEIMDVDELPFDWKYPAQIIGEIENIAAQGINLFKELMPETFSIFQESISYILMGNRYGYGGGSISSRISLIWLAPSKEWSIEIWAENILHELVHNILFIEELVNTIFLYSVKKMAEPNAVVISAIRQTERGFDKSFHSAFVSFSIAKFYLLLGHTEKVKSILPALIVCLNELVTHNWVLTINGKNMLDELINNTLDMAKEVNLQSSINFVLSSS